MNAWVLRRFKKSTFNLKRTGDEFFRGAKISLNKTDIEYPIDLLEKLYNSFKKGGVENQPTPIFDKKPLNIIFFSSVHF